MPMMPSGKDAIRYDEICMLVRGYAEKLYEGKMSYTDMLHNIDRITELAQEARKLWGER